MLEEHHQKLAKLITFRASQPNKPTDKPSESSPKPSTLGGESTPPPVKSLAKALRHPGLPSNSLPNRATRDLGSSIASNLASARGIPVNRNRKSSQAATAAVTQQNAEGKIVRPQKRGTLIDPTINDRKNNRLSEKSQATQHLDVLKEDQSTADTKEGTQASIMPKTDEPFNRFYATVETLFSRLSAPLAYAGLPLNSDGDSTPSAHETKAASQRPKSRTRATASPEYSRIFSPAAVRALREDTGTTALNTAESFYVVPTEGGSASYANILARHTQQHLQKKPDSGFDDADLSDEFVDAREKPGESPKIKRKSTGGRGASGKTLEELEWENQTLKTTCDDLAKRLHQFEFSSQASYQALHQSIRAASHHAGGDGSLETEAKLEALQNDVAKLKEENEQLSHYYNKYKDQLNGLRATAKAKRRGSNERPKGSIQ